MNREYDQSHQKPLSGRACVAVGIGFIAFLVVALVGVRMLSGG
jgi:uncharacterized spore protein YtfJ